jgi:hypothetical protein
MIDPVSRMAELGEHFLAEAKALDERVANAINNDAAQGAIESLMNLSATNRLRALSCYQACAPYLAPKLQAIEIAPASVSTASKFERAITNMSEAQIVEHLQQIASGSSAIALLEHHGANDD